MSLWITKKNSQSLTRIQTRNRSQRLCGGARRLRQTQTLLPSSRCPMGADRSHTTPDVVPTSRWCECARDVRQASDRVCFSCLSGSNSRSTRYACMRCRTGQEYPVLTNLLDVFKNEGNDEVHRFLLTHRVKAMCAVMVIR